MTLVRPIMTLVRHLMTRPYRENVSGRGDPDQAEVAHELHVVSAVGADPPLSQHAGSLVEGADVLVGRVPAAEKQRSASIQAELGV